MMIVNRAVLGALTLAGAASMAVSAAWAQQSVEFAMSAQNGSGHSGTATLYSEGDATRVIVRLDNPVPGPEPAHIHEGSCPIPSAAPLYPLNPVVDGKSETVLNVNLGAILSQTMAINIHKSPQEIAIYVSCGDIVLDDDITEETTIDSVRENAREGTNDEQYRKKLDEKNR